MKSYKKVIIVAAGRSGTKILRDVLVSFPDVATWPCDEINYIWKYGNRQHPSDELELSNLTGRIKSYINSQFDSLARKKKAKWIVEKTCANSLRVGYIESVLDEPLFIHLIRDGRDVMASSFIRWRAKANIRYLLRKAFYVPWQDLGYYSLKFLRNRIYKVFNSEKRLRQWGPVFKEMPIYLKNYQLQEVCALQWEKCVNKKHGQKTSKETANGTSTDCQVTLSHSEQFVSFRDGRYTALLSRHAVDYGTYTATELRRTGKSHIQGQHVDRV